jgi:hypothetical protein
MPQQQKVEGREDKDRPQRGMATAQDTGAQDIGAHDIGEALACSESSDADANRAAVSKSVDAAPTSTSAVDNGNQSELSVAPLQRARPATLA